MRARYSIRIRSTDAGGLWVEQSLVIAVADAPDGCEAEAHIKAKNASAGDEFGAAISFHGDSLAEGARGEDENTTIIQSGASAPNTNGLDDSSAVCMFRRAGALWAVEAYLKAPNASAGDRYGAGVALTGNSLAVWADGEDENQARIINGPVATRLDVTLTASGAAYICQHVARGADLRRDTLRVCTGCRVHGTDARTY